MSDMSPREYRIRALAYELWEKAGKPAGDHDRFWYEAEQQLDEEDKRAARHPPRMPQPS